MNQYDYFNSEFYSGKISVRDIVDFLKNQISPDQEISSDELLQKIQYNDISEKEISMNELAKFINKKRFPDVKKDFLLENFNRIIDAQRKRDKKSKSYSRRAFLDKYFEEKAPESEDTLAKWCKDEPKKESSRLKLLFAFDKMSVASEMFNDYFLKTVLEEQISKHVMKGENSKEDSLEVAMLSHALCTIGNKRFGKTLNADRAALIGLYHDATEIITGDMPTPVKYFNSNIKSVYKEIEHTACGKLLSILPEDLRGEYEAIFEPTDEYKYEKALVKAADKLSAYIKCLDEKKAGNNEFLQAEKATFKAVKELNLEEVEVFMKEFMPAYSRTLDEACLL